MISTRNAVLRYDHIMSITMHAMCKLQAYKIGACKLLADKMKNETAVTTNKLLDNMKEKRCKSHERKLIS